MSDHRGCSLSLFQGLSLESFSVCAHGRDRDLRKLCIRKHNVREHLHCVSSFLTTWNSKHAKVRVRVHKPACLFRMGELECYSPAHSISLLYMYAFVCTWTLRSIQCLFYITTTHLTLNPGPTDGTKTLSILSECSYCHTPICMLCSLGALSFESAHIENQN